MTPVMHLSLASVDVKLQPIDSVIRQDVPVGHKMDADVREVMGLLVDKVDLVAPGVPLFWWALLTRFDELAEMILQRRPDTDPNKLPSVRFRSS